MRTRQASVVVSRGLHVMAALLLSASGCTSGSDPGGVRSATSALNAEQCDYFAVNGRTRVCHATGSTRNPYVIINVATNACASGHANHPRDYIAVDDPDCSGQGCLPADAPCDSTLPCCAGATCLNGTCQRTPGVEDCTNGVDDDGDGLVDGADTEDCGSRCPCWDGGPDSAFPGENGLAAVWQAHAPADCALGDNCVNEYESNGLLYTAAHCQVGGSSRVVLDTGVIIPTDPAARRSCYVYQHVDLTLDSETAAACEAEIKAFIAPAGLSPGGLTTSCGLPAPGL